MRWRNGLRITKRPVSSQASPPPLVGPYDRRMNEYMTLTEFWIRLGVGVVLMVAGFALQAAWVSFAIIAVGVVLIVWTVVRAVRQVRRAEEIQRERRR